MGKQPPKKKLTIEQAEELMRQAEEKKRFATEQERIGKAQLKNNAKPGSFGSIGDGLKNIKQIPVGQERMDIARKLRLEASQDSLKAATSYPDYFKKRKK